MINLNIQKTYSNAYAKKTGMQSDLGNVNNLKQDTVSFNGWFTDLFASKPPEINVSQEVYQKICDWAAKNDGSNACNLMIELKKIVEAPTGYLVNEGDNVSIYAREIGSEHLEKVRALFEECKKTTNKEILIKCFGEWLKILGKGPLK